MKSITVRMFDLRWMRSNKTGFLHLTEILNKANNDLIFNTPFVTHLLDQFWDANFD